MVFSLFIHSAFPKNLISIGGLLLSGFIISRYIFSFRSFMQEFGLVFPRRIIAFLVIGLFLGFIYSSSYRLTSGTGILPKSLHQFTLVAALIGAIEELIFRGFIQGHARKINITFAVLFATFSHSAYKCCLFILPANNLDIHIGVLFLFTFIAGILLALLKEISKSTLPAILAHVVFDVMIYGECLQAPWWVW